MYSPGTLLRLAREKRNLTLYDVRTQLRIRASAILAMEQDQFHFFPCEYIQTFLPAYAEFLGVSAYKLAEAFAEVLPEHAKIAQHLFAQSLQQIIFAEVMSKQNVESQYAWRITHQAWLYAVARRYWRTLVALCCMCIVCGIGIVYSRNTSLVSIVVPTPEDMRGVPFTELMNVEAQSQNTPLNSCNAPEHNIQRVHVASLLEPPYILATAYGLMKHTADISYAYAQTVVDIAHFSSEANATYDPSYRSLSSVTATILARHPTTYCAQGSSCMDSSQIHHKAKNYIRERRIFVERVSLRALRTMRDKAKHVLMQTIDTDIVCNTDSTWLSVGTAEYIEQRHGVIWIEHVEIPKRAHALPVLPVSLLSL
ncbi:MAG: helix-turn-helix domain-containing protein [Bacteroidota bacterium]|nr:helix-turn-helix domain-containing protein [Candidatus Kapabacteria bacterium]MDW8219813.1 helix-turn-helix domain-containing protein [Bacteroidota bacterium]